MGAQYIGLLIQDLAKVLESRDKVGFIYDNANEILFFGSIDLQPTGQLYRGEIPSCNVKKAMG